MLDRLPPAKLGAVHNLLEVMIHDSGEPVTPEAVTEDDRHRFHEGEIWFAQHGGKGISMDGVRSEFGLKTEDFPLGT